MTKVSYKGEGDGRSCTVYGQTFPVGEWVEVEGLAAQKLPGNPMFEADGEEPEADGPGVDDLRAELDALGVSYHPRAGAAKLAVLLASAAQIDPQPEPDPEEADA